MGTSAQRVANVTADQPFLLPHGGAQALFATSTTTPSLTTVDDVQAQPQTVPPKYMYDCADGSLRLS